MSNHHAFYVVGEREQGIEDALAWGERVLGLPASGSRDVLVLRHELFSVEDARAAHEAAYRMPVEGEVKLIIIGASRIFHEAQNALLKLCEEPPLGTYLVFVLTSEGVLLPTLRSRLLPLAVPPASDTSVDVLDVKAKAFLEGALEEREAIVADILDKAKSDTPEEKQAARAEALSFVQALMKVAYAKREDPQVHALLRDLDIFIPILHERAAPLKPIMEHVLLVTPQPKN